ncbi:peptide/nickel transport system substrate-binding protein [Streptacidiphilus sp. MAP12-16]|uniref:ABC transporter substrate-binding protein n=1 Tax=Streptacidiphilus sp. MAP12-16 TaxID=3156300 RepID=UPI0035113DD0
MVVRESRRIRAVLAAACVSGLLLAGPAALITATSAAADSSTSATSGTTLRAAMDSSGVDTLNPFLAYFDGALGIFGDVYPALNSVSADGTSGPYLASSWTTSADKLTWTFKIRSGLTWSDGQPLTAEDAAWTFNLIMTNSTAATANGSLVSNFASVSAPDATTLVITTKVPQANMLSVSVPVTGIPIVPKHIWEQHTGDLKNFKNDSYPLVGYGPWQLTDYKPDQYAKLDANKTFVLGAPKFDHLIEPVYKTQDAAVAALRSGQLDFVSTINPTQYQALRGQQNLDSFDAAYHHWVAVEMNPGAKTRSGKAIGTGNPALADPAVRTAIALATDKKTLVTKVINGLGEPGAGYLPPAWKQWAWTPPAGEALDYDPAKANATLDTAGYTKGSDGIRIDPKTHKPLELRLGIHSDSARDTAISTYMSGWLAAVGIKVDIQSLSMSKLNDNLAKGDWDLLMDSWSTGADPTYLLGIQTCATLPMDDGTGGNTDAFYCNPEFDKLFQQQQTAFDPAQRSQIVGQMQDILYKANSDLILYYDNQLNVVRTDTVKNLAAGTADANGMLPAQALFWDYINAAPAKAAGSSSSSGAVGWGVGAAAVVLLAAGGLVIRRRRSNSDERE